jgi:hypothetical protein
MGRSFIHRFLLFSSVSLILLTFTQPSKCQSATDAESTINPPGIRLHVRTTELTVTVPLPHALEKSTRSIARVVLLNAEDIVRAQVVEPVELVRHQKQLVLRLAKPFANVPVSEMEALHWLRVKYEVQAESGEILASGIEALRAATTDPFILTAAASRVAAAGRPYRVQVHVRSNNGSPLAGVEVRGDVTWDDDGGKERKVNASAITNAGGNVTLPLLIPRDAHANDGDLIVNVKSGLVARSVERRVEFRSRSYLMLDTDKDIYQPGQTLHTRMLRFDSERKAVAGDTLDVRIEDEERTLVLKQTVATNAFGVAHLDWQIPPNVRMGTYVIRAWLSGQEDDGRNVRAEKSVHIYRYDLPTFRVSTHPDQAYYLQGKNADITVSAEYLFGKPVTRGKVRVVEETERKWNYRKQQWDTTEGQVQAGELDHDGHFTTHFDLSEAHAGLEDDDNLQFHDVNVAAYVTDLATGRTEQRRFDLRVTKNPIHVYVGSMPRRNPKMSPTFFVSTFYADGRPARCKVPLSLYDDSADDKNPKRRFLRTVETNKYGLAKVSDLNIPEDEDRDYLLVEARDAKGLIGGDKQWIYSDDDDSGVVEVTASHAIYKPGDPIEITLRSTRPSLHLVVQAVREGVVLASQQVRLRNGRGFTSFPYDPRFTDEVTILAFSLEEEWSSAALEGLRTVLYPKNRQLEMGIQLDKNEHRPGEDATARFAVKSADKTGTESALGIKIVDRAVEERAQTDSDFGQRNNWNWWNWSLWSSSNDSGFGGISRNDLDRIDLTQPVSPDLDLVAEYILQSSYQDGLEMLEDQSPLGPEQVFSKILSKQFEPVEAGLARWNEEGKQPHYLADLEAVGKEENVDVQGLLDPWGTPYRYALSFQNIQHILTVTSAGPDKHFGTKDDFTAHRSSRLYFDHYTKLIASAGHELMEKEGRFIRNLDTLQAELLKRGVDFKALTDPWGKPYEARFLISGPYYVTEIYSRGEYPEQKGSNGTLIWRDSVDYFVQSRANINKVLTAHLNAGGAYPNDEASFKKILREAGVDLDELHDPWGHPYYTVFQRTAQYSDRVRIQQTNKSGERVGEPVTLVRQVVNVMSAGPDGKPNTPDDFQVANYSILVSEQSANDATPRPAPPGMSLAENTGAISGTVVDPTGAVIVNAQVEATLEGTEQKHGATTDSAGRFELKDLQPGVYDIRADAQGFKALEVKAVLVQATNVTEVSFELSVGASSETVEVSGAAATLETTNASVAQIRSLPNLVTIAPGMLNTMKSGSMVTPRLREDFPETMLWEPALITDRRGHAKLNFKLADNITTWKLTAVGSTKNGELGRAEQDLRAFQPFFVEHDPPRILTQGDEISYPLILRNYLDRAQTLKASIKPEPWFTLLGPAEVQVNVLAGDYASAMFRYRAVAAVSGGKQQVTAANSEIGDAAQKSVDVHPFGRPLSVTTADIVDRKGTLTLTVPDNVIPGSTAARVKIYPNLLAHAVENLEAGLEKPHGCGEQTISSTYPSLMVAEIYAKSEQKPAIALKAQRYLAAGYERLLRYQAESGGFSYWGHGEAADLALTTYALEFLHRAGQIVTVDDGVPLAAEQWILQEQAPNGSWRGHWDKNDKDALLLTAYVAQTLAQLDGEDSAQAAPRRKSLERALAFLTAHRDLADEPYIIASYALAAKATGDERTFEDLLEWLRKSVHQQQGGSYWSLERNTPFYGWGQTGALESTALALRALASGDSRAGADRSLIRQGLLFLLRNEDKDGMWYSGQTTVNVLKTLLSMVVARDRETAGEITVRVNGKEAKVVELPAGQGVAAPIEVDVSTQVMAGKNQVELEYASEAMMSAQVVADLYVPWQDSSSVASKPEPNATSVLRYVVEYSNTKGTTSESVECSVRAERLGYRGYGMMLAEVGLPPGADVDRDSLENAMQGNYAVYRYDVLPDRVVLYLWPEAGGSSFSFRFRPRFAMQAETAPSLLYDYYNPDASITLRPSLFEVRQGSGETR